MSPIIMSQQGTNEEITNWVREFIRDRRSQNFAQGTLDFYNWKLRYFLQFCELNGLNYINEITPRNIRDYLLWLNEKGHNQGGLHAAYRALKTFLNWWEREVELDGWRNPIGKVAAPKLSKEILPPVQIETVMALIKVCPTHDLVGARDKAIFMGLLDTGSRANEFLSLNLEDVDLSSGALLIRRGKGQKTRMTFMGFKCRKALRAYFKLRKDNCPAVWVTQDGHSLTYWGLKSMFRRRAKAAGIPEPSIHSFRRAFAINMLKAGVDIYRLRDLMGHTDIQVLTRYLQINYQDLRKAHEIGSPADRLL